MKRFLIGLLAILLVSPALAQAPQTVRLCSGTPCVPISSTAPLPVSTSGAGGGASSVSIEGDGNTATVRAANTPSQAADSALVVSIRPEPGAVTTAGCTVGAASALCVPAATATRWIQVQNTHATNAVACSWGGPAVLNAAGSFMLASGQAASWGPNTGGVPSNALNCIASGAGTPLYVEHR